MAETWLPKEGYPVGNMDHLMEYMQELMMLRIRPFLSQAL